MPQPLPAAYPADWLCVPHWFVGAELVEPACDFAAAFWFAELGPEVTPPAEIVTGAFPFTGVCSVEESAAETCPVLDSCPFACAAPAPPQPAAQVAAAAPADWLWFVHWLVGAELDESACDFA